MADNSTYALTTSGSWIVPTGVTSITVECFGSVNGVNEVNYIAPAQTARSGASYSKSTNVSVTAGQVFYHNIGASGGNTWFNNINSAPVVGVNPTTTSCLAVGGNTDSASQVAANIGDVKYAGGAGLVSTGQTVSGTGGNAGPNGAGAAAGNPYSNTPNVVDGTNYFIGSGGGANGGSQGGLGVIPYGRTGSGGTPGAGNGGYWNGTSDVSRTTDITLSSYYTGNTPSNTITNYGTSGGDAVSVSSYCFCCSIYTSFNTAGNNGFIVITLNAPTQKSILFVGGSGGTSGSFTVPADFVSLVSLEAVGRGGAGYEVVAATGGGGGGGGAYSKTNSASVTASIVAGSTTVYYEIFTDPWLRIGTNSAPSSITDGVLAKSGNSSFSNTGASGGSAASGVGDTKYSGGTGGAGYTSSRYNSGGGGGSAGPSGGGGNGGAANNTTAYRGSGGGGSIGSAGSAGSTSAGGAGGAGFGTGGAGATSSTLAGAGTNGGGSGGGYGSTSFYIKATPTNYSANGIYNISGGQGGGTTTSIFGGGGGAGGGAWVVVFTYVPTNDKNAALTGASSSGSAGTLSPSQTLIQALSNASASASAGTLTNSQALTLELSGALASAFGGNLNPTSDLVLNLTSASVAALAGTLALETSIALTGSSVSGETSSFPALLDLVGVEASGLTGSLDYRNTGWQVINTDGPDTWTDVNTQP